jgi:hypothetical protein
MSLLLPQIGITDCSRAITLIKNYTPSIVGTFWVMNGYGFDDDVPGWWIDFVLKENQAQAILDAFDRETFSREHDGPPYLGFCIIVVADSSNPANFSYVIQHLRMIQTEGMSLLRALAGHNIPAITDVAYPIDFLQKRHGYRQIPDSLKNLHYWSVQVWEDYCSYLIAEYGQQMVNAYWLKFTS